MAVNPRPGLDCRSQRILEIDKCKAVAPLGREHRPVSQPKSLPTLPTTKTAAMIASVALLMSGLAATVLGHGMVTTFKTDGVQNQGFILDYYYDKKNGQPVPDIAAWYAENLDSGFVAPNNYGTQDINCHINATPGTLSTTVSAGGKVEFQWPATWPHPYGPIITYVAKCAADCTKADKSQLKWVKIEAVGSMLYSLSFGMSSVANQVCSVVNYSTQKWASQTLIDQAGKWTTTVPKSLAPGNYVFRHEIIALHGAGSLNGAQNYPQCFNIKITGSGTANPTGTAGTALYKNTDPGIYFNPYTTITNYAMPGPTLWTG